MAYSSAVSPTRSRGGVGPGELPNSGVHSECGRVVVRVSTFVRVSDHDFWLGRAQHGVQFGGQSDEVACRLAVNAAEVVDPVGSHVRDGERAAALRASKAGI